MASGSKGPYGIQELYRPVDIEPDMDIVAVHGLNGGSRSTWTSRKTNVCWLEHPEFLPNYLRSARILAWGYNASFSSLVGDQPSQNRIHHHAHTLVANLYANRLLEGMAYKPIIFLCHSLGGIVVKRALSYSHTRTGHKVSHEYSIFSSTYGILFFGTPHTGSEKANWLGYLKKISLASHSDLVSALEKESETLQNVTDYFVPLMNNFRISFFWEQKMTDLRLGLKDYIVTRESAAPPYDEAERSGIAADHSGMVKFDDPKSQAFQVVVDILRRYCEQAPAAISRNQVYEAELLKRERVRQAMDILDSIPDPVPARPIKSSTWEPGGKAAVKGLETRQIRNETMNLTRCESPSRRSFRVAPSVSEKRASSTRPRVERSARWRSFWCCHGKEEST